MDYYLKFESEEQADSVLLEAVATEDGEAFSQPKYQVIDTIGVIYEQDGENLIALEGWHVNVRLMPGEDASPIEPYSVQPSHPRRVFA